MGPFASVIAIIFCLLAIIGAFLVVRQRDPVLASILTILVSAGIGIVFIAAGAHLIGIIQILIFTPAIAWIFKNAVSDLGDPNIRRDPIPMVRVACTVAVTVLGLILFIDLAPIINGKSGPISFGDRDFSDFAVIIPRYLSDWMYPVILIAMLATVTAVFSAHLARERRVKTADKERLGAEGDTS